MRVIEKKIMVSATPADVWQAWTTNKGVRSFFAPDSDIECTIGGKYEVFFNSLMPYGGKGSEGCQITSYVPNEMLSFTWNAPPSIPALRNSGAFTNVVIKLSRADDQTKVELTHFVDKEGEDWEQYYEYFLRAWDVVLGRLSTLFLSGPIDWVT
jgi:uncharacterized protein YndB with AHSA1/START domain